MALGLGLGFGMCFVGVYSVDWRAWQLFCGVGLD